MKRKSPMMLLVEKTHGADLESLLRYLYHGQGLTMLAISERLGVTEATVSRWMDRLGIPARHGRLERTGS